MTHAAQLHAPPPAPPQFIEAQACYASGRIDKASALLEGLFQRHPQQPDIRKLLFACYKDGGHTDKMLDMAAQFQTSPEHMDELALVWQAYLAICDFDTAAALQQQVLRAAENGELSSDLLPAVLLTANALPDPTAEEVFALHRTWAKTQTAPGSGKISCRPIFGRIRIAYISGDFFRHPVSYFLLPVLASHDRTRFEIYCYSNTCQPSDDLSAAIRQSADAFVDITDMSNEELAARMQRDNIHIAVDLSGHTANSRTAAFARRLAPVQISWLGYPNTTGLTEMDYRITDQNADPQDIAGSGNGTRYTEKLLYMPNSFLCYGIQWDVEPAHIPPCRKNGYITFASFNNGRKINAQVIDAWSGILHKVQGAQLLLKFSGCMQPAVQENLAQMFHKRGIEPSRIRFLLRAKTVGEHIERYRDVDIALDTFPYTGTTTTFEALSQGVPVITLCGSSHAGRVSTSILKSIGYEETMTHSVEAYQQRAIELADNPGALSSLRTLLPLLVKHAPVAEPEIFTRQLESLFLRACEEKGLHDKTDAQGQDGYQQATALRRLHIGGHERHPDWEIMDAIASDITDHVGNASDLSRFDDNTFEAVYASHVLEHFSYQRELQQVLSEWQRVLKPGGDLYASVPDLEVLCRLFLEKDGITSDERFLLMRMMFGGQIDPYDFHKAGLYEELLTHHLKESGFVNIERVGSFALFRDTSSMQFHDQPISLNLVAKKPETTG